MEITQHIDKVQYAKKRGVMFIAPSDAQPILKEAYGDSDNWPLPDEQNSGHYPIATMEKAIKTVRSKAQQQAQKLSGDQNEPTLPGASETEVPDDDEPDTTAPNGTSVQAAQIPESAKSSLMDSGFYTFEQIEQYLDQGGALTDFKRIGESTANRIMHLLGRTAEPQPVGE